MNLFRVKNYLINVSWVIKNDLINVTSQGKKRPTVYATVVNSIPNRRNEIITVIFSFLRFDSKTKRCIESTNQITVPQAAESREWRILTLGTQVPSTYRTICGIECKAEHNRKKFFFIFKEITALKLVIFNVILF